LVKYIVLACLSLTSSVSVNPLAVTILPIQCFNDPYLDKVLDSIRYEESCNGKYLINYNYKNEEIDSMDEGEYQLNSKNKILFANLYNDGRMYDPYDNEIARRIARLFLLNNYKITGNMTSALMMYNCGIGNWNKGPPLKSLRYAERILRRIK
jgi:hypothetical protein